MRILLFGKNGQLGKELTRQLNEKYDVVSLARDDADLADSSEIVKLIKQHRPQIVVNAAAYTAVDKAESEPDVAHAINGTAPGVMARAARNIGALFVHFSTDYVFDGDATSPYHESDPTNPQSVYGCTKLAGEKTVQKATDRFLILRTSWVYAQHGHNFLNTMLGLAKERDELSVVNDQHGAPTYVPDLAHLSKQLIDGYATKGESLPFGIYHATGDGVTTWFEFAREIFTMSGNSEIKLNPISTADYPTPAKRPRYSVLSNEKLKKHFGLSLPDWRDALMRCLQST